MKFLAMMLMVAIIAVTAGCGAWRPCASVIPPMAPSYCAPMYDTGSYSYSSVPPPPSKWVPPAPSKRVPPPPSASK